MTNRPPTIDPVAAARWARATMSESPWLHEEVARRMAERLEWIKLQPSAWLDWMPVSGGLAAHALLVERYPTARPFVAELPGPRSQTAARVFHQPWWQPGRWRRPLVNFDLPETSRVDMVWANMALHTSADPAALMAHWYSLLATNGFLMLSCLGPDSLRELRHVYAAMGWAPPSHAFTDMHDWGDMLVHSGFAEPVMDMERITLAYSSPERLLDDLRTLGRNLHPQRDATMHGRHWRQRLLDALHQHMVPAGEERMPWQLTFEVIYGHALKPPPRLPRGEQVLPLDDVRNMLRQSQKPN